MAVARAVVGLRPLADQLVLVASPTGDAVHTGRRKRPADSLSAEPAQALAAQGLSGAACSRFAIQPSAAGWSWRPPRRRWWPGR